MGTAITISGTVGAALEGAALGIPALAISLQTGVEYHLSYSQDVNFSVAGYFTTYFGRILLERSMPEDVDVLKVDIPADASIETPWEVTRLSRMRYYEPLAPERKSWEEPTRIGYAVALDADKHGDDTDVYVLHIRRHISVTPLSLDLTSRVNFHELEALLQRKDQG